MADYLSTDLRSDVLQELRDPDQTRFKDPLLKVFINDGLIFMKEEIIRQNKWGTLPEEFPLLIVDKDEFSSDKKHVLPEQYMEFVQVKKSGAELPIRMGQQDIIDDQNETEERGTIYASRIGPPVPSSSNTGADTLITREGEAGYTGTADDTVTVTIDTGATTFTWSSTVNGSGAGVTITTNWLQLGTTGIFIKFGSTTQVATDVWTFVTKKTYRIKILQLNFAPTVDMEVWAVRRHDVVTLDGVVLTANEYLPFYRYNLALKQYVMIKCQNYAEKNVRQDAQVMGPVINLITEIASGVNRPSNSNVNPANKSVDYI